VDSNGVNSRQPTPSSRRRLIVNADDFGQTRGINHGVTLAIEHGIVTSASLMVRWPAAREVIGLTRKHPNVSVGLHVDLGEWTFQNGSWAALYQVVPIEDRDAVAAEVARQLAMFRRLTGNDPTHVDSHQHVHRQEPVYGVVVGLAERLGIPVRHYSPLLRHCGAFYGQTAQGQPELGAVSASRLIRILQSLPPGLSELSCHPGRADDLNSMYRDEREIELQALCDSQVRGAISELGIELCSFRDVFRIGVN
jgi:predicted glycoside hydrolase/deacetylase ChbG (UPF0249 family)